MNKIKIAIATLAAATLVWSCNGANGNDPGDIYAPDMAYSRAYETYGYNNVHGEFDSLKANGVSYNGMPVPNTRARGDAYTFPVPGGDSGYNLAKSYVSPMQSVQLTATQLKDAERVYLINCGICHGQALDGNGPLWKGGDGPYPAAPRPLNGEYVAALSDAQIYHAITYGKGQMGSYASQVRPEQRWWLVNYIRTKGAKAAAGSKDSLAGNLAAPVGGTGSPGSSIAPNPGTTADSAKKK